MIKSTANEKIKHISLLVKSAKARRKEGLFVVEGERMAAEIPKDLLVECFVSENYMDSGRFENIFSYEVDPVIVSSDVFKKMSDTQSPQGIMCVCRQISMPVGRLLDFHRDDLHLLVLEKIQDPGNLGTMVRTAEGAGFDAVIADEETVDIYNPKVTRSTMGSLFRVPVIYVKDILETVDTLKNDNVTVYASHPDATADYRNEHYGRRVAILVGNEGNGLSEELSDRSDVSVVIPMKGKLESLNAAVAAALIMYECKRDSRFS